MSIENVMTSRTFESECELENSLYDAERCSNLLLIVASHLGLDRQEFPPIQKGDAHTLHWLLMELSDHVEKALTHYDGARRHKMPENVRTNG